MIHRPICSACHVEMRCSLNGVVVVDHASFGPYALWNADEWECQSCAHKIIIGFGDGPSDRHFEETFPAALASIPAELRRDTYESVEVPA